jgi:hypothetical protein
MHILSYIHSTKGSIPPGGSILRQLYVLSKNRLFTSSDPDLPSLRTPSSQEGSASSLRILRSGPPVDLGARERAEYATAVSSCGYWNYLGFSVDSPASREDRFRRATDGSRVDMGRKWRNKNDPLRAHISPVQFWLARSFHMTSSSACLLLHSLLMPVSSYLRAGQLSRLLQHDAVSFPS